MIRDLLLLKTSRRVCCPQAAKTIHSCAPAAQGELAKGQEKVAWAMYGGKILLGPQVCPQGARSGPQSPRLEKAEPFSNVF